MGSVQTVLCAFLCKDIIYLCKYNSFQEANQYYHTKKIHRISRRYPVNLLIS